LGTADRGEEISKSLEGAEGFFPVETGVVEFHSLHHLVGTGEVVTNEEHSDFGTAVCFIQMPGIRSDVTVGQFFLSTFEEPIEVFGHHEMAVVGESGPILFAIGEIAFDFGSVGANDLVTNQMAGAGIGGEEVIAVIQERGFDIRFEELKDFLREERGGRNGPRPDDDGHAVQGEQTTDSATSPGAERVLGIGGGMILGCM